MLLTIRCWIVQMLMPKELRIYFQLFLSEKIKEMEQELENIAYGKAESKDRGMTEEEIKKAINVLKNSAPVFPLKKSEEYNNYVQTINQVIDWLEHEPRWIFVSERLPNHDEYIKNNGLFIVSDGNRSYSEWFDIYDKQKFGEPTMNGFRVDYAATAWMPLPEPYEPQKREGL